MPERAVSTKVMSFAWLFRAYHNGYFQRKIVLASMMLLLPFKGASPSAKTEWLIFMSFALNKVRSPVNSC